MFWLFIRHLVTSSLWTYALPRSFSRQLAEEALFQGIVAGFLPSQVAHHYRVVGIAAENSPSAAGARLLTAFEATVWAQGEPYTRRYPLQAARHHAQGRIQELVAAQALAAQTRVTWGVAEFEAEPSRSEKDAARALEEPTVKLPWALPPPRRKGPARFQVCLAPEAWEQARREVLRDPTQERGGFLCGSLRRRPDDRRVAKRLGLC